MTSIAERERERERYIYKERERDKERERERERERDVEGAFEVSMYVDAVQFDGKQRALRRDTMSDTARRCC